MTTIDWSEVERLAALDRYAILDTPPEPEFDDAVGLVKTICQVPIALVSLVDADRQWFKAKVGVDLEQTALDTSVCALAIRQDGLFVIEDLSRDPRTCAMSLVTDVPYARFYAGMPLVTSDGLPLGSLCAIDVVPRPQGLTTEQALAMKALARQIVAQVELRSAVATRDRALVDQERRQVQATRDSTILQTMLQAQQRILKAGGAFDAALQALVQAALDAIEPADGVVVELIDGDELRYHAAAGVSASRVGMRLPVASSFSGWAIRAQSTLITADVLVDRRGIAAAATALGVRSAVIVPLSRHGTVFGVLKLHAPDPDMFRSRHILIAQMLAGLIAASFTENAEAAALLQVEESHRNYRHIVDSAIDSAIISTDAAGIVTSWSKGGETIFGWSEAEMVGQPLDRIYTPEDHAIGRCAFEIAQASATGRASDERWHMRKDGSRFYANGAITPLKGGAATGFVKSLRDITAEHVTRQALEASRLRIDTALETGLIAFFSWDVRAGLIRGDTRYADFHGIDPTAVAGVPMNKAFANIFPADRDAIVADVTRATGRCADFSSSFRIIGNDGQTRWMLVRGRCVERDGDTPLCYVGTAVDVSVQREAEERLQVSLERLELTSRAAKLGSFDYLPQTGQLDWDDRCRELFGLPPGAPVSYEEAFLAGLHPDDRVIADAAVADALDPAGTGVFHIEYRTIGLVDRIERTLLADGLALFVDGQPVRLIGTVQDITADRRARAQLLETEERLRLAARATNDAIWDWDLLRDHVLWNDALERVYGHPLADVAPTGAWWLAQIHVDDRARVEHGIHAAIDGGEHDWSDEYRFRRSDGSYADVRDRGYVIRDDDGRAVRMIGALLDQSDRKRIERELTRINQTLETSVSEQTEELDRLWDTSPDLLVLLDFDGILQSVNPAWTAILGYAPGELIGRHVNTLVVADDVALTERALSDASAGPLPVIENRYVHKDGSVRWFSWVAAPTDGQIYATGRDITADKMAQAALRRAEDQLRQAQKVEAVGQLTGGVAHDFNNLLTVIRGSVDLLRRPGVSPDRQRRYIDAIADTAERATKLTSQLLAFARRSALKPEVFDVGRSIVALRDMMGTLTGGLVTLSVDLPGEPCFVDADPSQFDTAIVNMAVNARDAMERGGTLEIAVRATSAMPAIRTHPLVEGDFVAVAIRDTGAGIAADRIDQIFEPFFTTKAVGEGTGLGLSQVFGFAKQSGGEIQAESEPGQGATFTLYLPRATRTAPAASPAPARDAETGKGICVLVVEDNPDVGSFATQALAELGYATVLAGDATRALDMIERGGAFDIVFSDVVMPGMTGIEMALEIRRRAPDLPVVLTSGYSSVLAQEGTHGFDLLHKPYSIDALSQILRRALATAA